MSRITHKVQSHTWNCFIEVHRFLGDVLMNMLFRGRTPSNNNYFIGDTCCLLEWLSSQTPEGCQQACLINLFYSSETKTKQKTWFKDISKHLLAYTSRGGFIYYCRIIKWLAPRNDAQQPLVMEEQGRQEVKAWRCKALQVGSPLLPPLSFPQAGHHIIFSLFIYTALPH